MPELAEKTRPDRDDSITLQKPARFTMAGLVLYGPRWKAPLARALGVSRETVSRWVGRNDIPEWAANAIALHNAAKGSVLSLCDRTGNMVRPWADAGFECFCADLRHSPGDDQDSTITWIKADVREWALLQKLVFDENRLSKNGGEPRVLKVKNTCFLIFATEPYRPRGAAAIQPC